jgi:hypothetical protein
MLQRFLGDCPDTKIWNIHIHMSQALFSNEQKEGKEKDKTEPTDWRNTLKMQIVFMES